MKMRLVEACPSCSSTSGIFYYRAELQSPKPPDVFLLKFCCYDRKGLLHGKLLSCLKSRVVCAGFHSALCSVDLLSNFDFPMHVYGCSIGLCYWFSLSERNYHPHVAYRSNHHIPMDGLVLSHLFLAYREAKLSDSLFSIKFLFENFLY